MRRAGPGALRLPALGGGLVLLPAAALPGREAPSDVLFRVVAAGLGRGGLKLGGPAVPLGGCLAVRGAGLGVLCLPALGGGLVLLPAAALPGREAPGGVVLMPGFKSVVYASRQRLSTTSRPPSSETRAE